MLNFGLFTLWHIGGVSHVSLFATELIATGLTDDLLTGLIDLAKPGA